MFLGNDARMNFLMFKEPANTRRYSLDLNSAYYDPKTRS